MGSRVELFERIRRDHDLERLSIRALAVRYGVHRRTVRQALQSASPPERKRPEGRSAPALGEFHGLIDEWLIADRSAPLKQRHTVLTDTEDGDDGAMLDGDEHWERPNDRTTKAQTCVREPGPSSVPIPPAIRGRRATPSRRHAPSHRSRVSHNRGRGQPSARTPPGSEAGVRRAAVEQPAGHRDRQLPRAGAHPELRPARPDRDAERLDGVRERRSRGPRRRERRVDRVCP